MEWAFALALFVGLVALQVYWRRRCDALQRALEQERREGERCQQEGRQAVARELAQQEALFDSMAEGLLVVDAGQRVRLVNQPLRQWFGLADDPRGRTLIEVFRQHTLQELAQRAVTLETGAAMELDLPGPPPRTLQVSATAFLNHSAQAPGAIVVFHDLTRLKQLENLRQEFVGNVSHELRTPLSMIKGCVETLLDGAKDQPEANARFLTMIQRHADRLTFLIEDLLTLSQLESGRLEFRWQPVELRTLAGRVLEDLGARAVERETSLHNLVPPGLTALADADRLQQVFYNLVENAIKYGRARGRVEISAQSVPLNLIEIRVQDDGPGLPPEAIDRVFERFYRVDRARSRDQGGTGLGLAIVKHLVQAHQGTVWVRSEPGQGAAFCFTLPSTEPPSR